MIQSSLAKNNEVFTLIASEAKRLSHTISQNLDQNSKKNWRSVENDFGASQEQVRGL